MRAGWLRRLRGALFVAALPLSGCVPSLTPYQLDAPEGYTVFFPAPPITAAGHDGPVRYRIHAVRPDGAARYESAWFGFPVELDAAGRLDLLTRVEKGLAADGARVTARTETPAGNKDHIDLILDHKDGRRGYHRILYPDARSMLQVSVVGPRGGDWEELVPLFFASLKAQERLRGS